MTVQQNLLVFFAVEMRGYPVEFNSQLHCKSQQPPLGEQDSRHVKEEGMVCLGAYTV